MFHFMFYQSRFVTYLFEFPYKKLNFRMKKKKKKKKLNT